MLTALEKAKRARREDRRDQPAARGGARPLQEPADARAASSAAARALADLLPAGPGQRRPRALPGDRPSLLVEWERRTSRPRLHRRAHSTASRSAPRTSRAARLGPRSTAPPACPASRSTEAAPRCSRRRPATVVLLGDGPDPAPQRGRHHQGDRQPRLLLQGNIGKPGAGPVPGPRPLQRAGRPHHGHLGAAAGRLPGRAAATSSASSRPASTAYDVVDSIQRAARRRGAGLLRAGRQLRRGHAGHRRVTEAALRKARPDRARLDQAQPLAPVVPATTALILPTLGRTEKDIQAGGAAVRLGRGLDVLGARLARPAASRPRRTC